MTQPQTPVHIDTVDAADYRHGYANSVQMRASLWDFTCDFGLIRQTGPLAVRIENFQTISISPQQAKALLVVLQQNVQQYERAFGVINLEASPGTGFTPNIMGAKPQ